MNAETLGEKKGERKEKKEKELQLANK